jgi:hypothetical protein
MTKEKKPESNEIKVWIWNEIEGYIPGVALEIVKEGIYRDLIKCLVRGNIEYYSHKLLKRRKF